MDAEISAALAPEALAPPIARDLGLSEAAVVGVLRLLAAGAQPAFLARFRPERTGSLTLRDLERVQARAAQAVAFEFKRAQLRQELQAKNKLDEEATELLGSAQHPVQLEDLRVLLRKRSKKSAAGKARSRGLGVLAGHLWACGSDGRLKGTETAEPTADPLALAKEHPGRALPPRNKGKKSDKKKADEKKADEKKVAGDEPAKDEATEAAPEAETAEPSKEVAADGAPEAVVAPDVTADAAAEVAPESAPEEAVAAEATPESAPEEAVAAETTPESAPEEVAAEAAPETAAAEAEPETVAQPDASEAATEQAPAAEEAAAQPAPAEAPLLPSPERDLASARIIIADDAFSIPMMQRRLRDLVLQTGRLRATLVPGKKDKGGRFAKLAERVELIAKASATHVLGLLRGERDGALQLSIEIEPEAFDRVCDELLGIDATRPCGAQLRQALHEGWLGAPGGAVRHSARKLLKQRVDRRAIGEFCEAYRPLLLAPAFGSRPILAIDPGFAPGCKVAALGADGTVLARETLFPLQPKLQAPQAKARLVELIGEHGAELVVVGNGNGGRDVERLAKEAVREAEGLTAVVVSGDGDTAALFASSRLAKQQLPKDDASMRRAIALGRRLQDPLTELAKLDPRKLPLGQYQHEVDQEELRAALEQVLVSCINEIGVDLNRADADELARVAGFSHALAKAVVTHRDQHGPFPSRQALLDVPGVAGKAFEQGAGFLRIDGGDHALDRTSIHPERYGQIVEMARELGVTVGDLVGDGELVGKLDPSAHLGKPGASGEPLGKATMAVILQQLQNPGADPRPPFVPVEFSPEVEKFEDLKVGMELPGVITHLANFGAFVDVGLAEEGLVHVSELTHGFISSPGEAVHVGQRVKGRVIEISPDRKRFSLSLRALLPKPEGKGRSGGKRGRKGDRGGKDRGPRRDGPPKGKRGRKGDRGGGGRGGKDRDNDRVLGFKLDLSDLAERLGKG